MANPSHVDTNLMHYDLMQGVPVLTLLGDSFPSRVAASLLESIVKDQVLVLILIKDMIRVIVRLLNRVPLITRSKSLRV